MNDYLITKGRCGMKAAVMLVMTLLMLPLSLYAQEQQLEPPTISPRGENWYGAYYTDQLFTLSCETPNVTIKYFFDSYENEPNAVTYTGPFTLQAGDNYILYASYGPNYPTDPNDVCPSDGAAYYIFKKPVFSPEPGTYDEGVNVSVSYETITYSDQDVQDKLKYSVDGNTYNDYTAAISLSTSKTVNAYIYVYNSNGEIDHTPAVSAAYNIRPNLYFVDPAVTANQVKMDAASAIYPYTYTTSRPQLYNPHQLDVTWASSNTSVATVSSDGTVTIVGAGDTEISAAFAGNSDYVANTAKYTLHVDPQSLTGATVTVDPTSVVYTGAEQKPTVTVSQPNEKVAIVIDAANYDVSYTNNINVGTATVTITGKGNYSGSASTTFTITKATPTVTAPTAKTLTYTGAAQELVNAGSTTGGTLEYSLDGTNYSKDIPTASAVGTYNVHYRVSGGDNYNDVAAASITVTIAKATPTVTAPTAKTLTYTGAAQELVNAGSTTGGTLEYSLDGTTYSATIPTATAVGSYTVHYRVTGGDNYNDVAVATVTATISASQSAVATAPTANSLTYTGSAQALVTAGTATNGTMQYSADGQNFGTDIPTGTNAGSYDVWYKVVGNTGYNDTEAVKLTVTIAKATPTVTAPTGKQLNYTGAAQELVNAGSTTGGTLEYSLDGTNYNKDIPTASAVGTYTVSYRVTGDTNYNDVAAASVTATISASQATVAILPTANSLTYTGSAQALVTAGTATNGTMQYSADGQSYSTTIPTGTNAGSYDVWYKVVGNTGYNDTEAVKLTVTIAKATPTLTFSETSLTGKVGVGFTPPTLTITPQGLTVSYSSSNTSVATVNATTGVVEIIAEGTTTIKATFTENSNYKGAEASYTLTVEHADAKPVEISFVEDKVTATYGDKPFESPALNLPAGTGITADDIEWSSSMGKVATVEKGGVVTIKGAGETAITASFPGNADYEAASASYTLKVEQATAKIAFGSETEFVVLPAKQREEDMVTKTMLLQIEKEAGPETMELDYTSSDENVATVRTIGDGVVNVVCTAPGTVKITATFKGDNNWKPAKATCTVTVTEPVKEGKVYSFDASIMLNPDGTEKDLSGTILLNTIIAFMKNQLSPEGDGWDPDENCIVINTETLTAKVQELLEKGVTFNSKEWFDAFAGLVFMLPADAEEGELEIVSQEEPGSQLMVMMDGAAPIAISNPEKHLYSIAVIGDADSSESSESLETFGRVYMWNSAATSPGPLGDARTRTIEKGKKTTGKIKVHSVAYKSSNGSGIQTIKQLLPIDDGKWYDLNGQRISKPTQKGIYILGHRKVVVK